MPIRLLIAEDNPVVRTAMHQLLERAGDWEIIDAENGQEAIAKAQELAPNLIILDLVMPVMDGLAAAREISKLVPQTPLLMHTLHWTPQVELEAQKVGVRKVVPKADSNELVSAIRHFLNADPQPVAAAVPDGISPVDLPVIPSNSATPDITALPPLLDGKEAENVVEFDVGKVTDIGAANAPEKPDATVELDDLAIRRPAS
jgi:DNA-binding NarL/FixJ family response regulator